MLVFDSPLPETGYAVLDVIIYWIHSITLFMVNGPIYMMPYFFIMGLCCWLGSLVYFLKQRYINHDVTYKRDKTFDSILVVIAFCLYLYTKEIYHKPHNTTIDL